MNLGTSIIVLYFATLTCWTQADRLLCPKQLIGNWPIIRVNTTQRLIWLRNEMGRVTTTRGPMLNAYIVTSHDEHQSEYLLERDKRLKFISGFSGLFGYAVITRTAAALWTTEKYYELADEQLDCNWELMKLGDPGTPTMAEWLKRVLLRNLYRVGADPKTVSSIVWDEWNRDLGTECQQGLEDPLKYYEGVWANFSAEKLALTEVQNNLVDTIWSIARPGYNPHPAFILPIEFTGETWESKVTNLRQNLTKFGCDAMVVTALEEISWLLNFRGKDMLYNPFVKSYLIVEKDSIRLYMHKNKFTEGVRRLLKFGSYGPLSVRLLDYDTIFSDIRTLSQAWNKVLLPVPCFYSGGASQAVVSSVPPEKRVLRQSPIIFAKAKKNLVEAAGMRKANLRDSAIFIDFMAHVEEEEKKGHNLTEVQVITVLEHYRRKQDLNQGMSFPTVAAFGPHGARLYHEPNNRTNKRIDGTSTLVMESGGHYYDGTADVTRTFHYGNPTRNMIEAYTSVLSALIQLTMSTFPPTTKVQDLDTIVRSKLWKAGINYKMELGHGIGFFSNVRESPIMLSSDPRYNKQTLREGYFFTCEPFFVVPRRYGIKLGNILEVVTKTPEMNQKPGEYLGLKEVTLVPFERKLIDPTMLSREELNWINAYHRRVLQEVGVELKKQKRMKGFYWLMEKTKELSEHCVIKPAASLATLPTASFVLFCIFFSFLS